MRKFLYDDGFFPRPVGMTNGFLQIQEASSSIVDGIIAKHHYSGKSTPNRFLSFLVNKDMGALQLGYGIRPHIKHTIAKEITADNYCEFDRMWLSDELPKNSESQVIALLLHYLKHVYPRIKFVITYADESAGNVGTIYRATNAYEIEPVQVDFYVLQSGERVHPVSMWHRHGTRAKEFLEKQYPGIRHIKGEQLQRRFLYVLHNGLRRKFQERNAPIPLVRAGGGSQAPLKTIIGGET